VSNTDWVSHAFPGDPFQQPSTEERDHADGIIADANTQWGESHRLIARTHPDVGDEGFGNYLAGMPTNRAYLRAQLRRWWGRRH
jgi:hypothetical protein